MLDLAEGAECAACADDLALLVTIRKEDDLEDRVDLA